MAMLNNQRVFVYTVNPSLLAEAQFDPGTADIPMFVGLNPEIYPIFSSNAALESPILMVTALIKLRQVKSKVSRFCRVNPIKSHFLTILFQSYESVKHCFFSRINHIIFSFWTTKTWFFAKKSTFFLLKCAEKIARWLLSWTASHSWAMRSLCCERRWNMPGLPRDAQGEATWGMGFLVDQCLSWIPYEMMTCWMDSLTHLTHFTHPLIHWFIDLS